MSAALNTKPDVTPATLRRVAAASSLGTTVEWYDFFIYATAPRAGAVRISGQPAPLSY
jgi:hypothetical protein